MSESVRPSIPRPRTSAPPAPRPTAPPAPASGPALIKTTPPAAMRERLATLDLDDGDIVGVAVTPIKTGPPAVPVVRKTSAPPPPRATSVPSPPASTTALIDQTPTTAPASSFAPPRVPTFAPTPSVRPRNDTEVEIERGWDDAAASFAQPSWAEDTAPALPPVAAAPASVAPPPAPVSIAPPVSVAPPVSAVSPPVSMMRPVTPAQPVAPQFLRLSINDPTDLIFDGMYGLTFARSTGEAAEMCAETLAKALGARAVVIHTHDLVSRELRAIGAHGDGDFDIIGSAEASDDDLVAAAVICNQRSVTMKFDGELPRLAPKRLHAVGAPRTVVAAPAMSWGRCLAIIEVIDADERYAARVADSAAYVAEHFAQFLCAHAA